MPRGTRGPARRLGRRVLAHLCPQAASDESTAAAAQVDTAQLYLASFTLVHEKGTLWVMGLTLSGVGGPLRSPGYDAMGHGESFSAWNRAPGPCRGQRSERDHHSRPPSLPGRRRWSVSLSPPVGSPASLLHHVPAQQLLGSHPLLPGGSGPHMQLCSCRA